MEYPLSRMAFSGRASGTFSASVGSSAVVSTASSSRSQEKNDLMAAMRWRLATISFASSHQPFRSCFRYWSRRPRRSFSKSASAHCAK